MAVVAFYFQLMKDTQVMFTYVPLVYVVRRHLTCTAHDRQIVYQLIKLI